MKLSKNFSLREFTKSNTADRLGIDNNPTEQHLENLKDLCTHILQPLRTALGLPIRLNSGYRSKELNEAVKGSKTSDHCYGRAADIELWVQGEEDNALLWDTIISLDLPFKQLIWEFGTDLQPSWVHISYDKNNSKKEILKAYKDKGVTKYKRIN